mgnify:FL=1
MAKQSTAFAVTFVALFALAFVFLAAVDALPEPLKNQNPIGTQDVPKIPDVQTLELPVRIVAKSIGLDKTVANPDATDVAALDAALLGGTVRYPTSAKLGEEGTVLIFGHSSYLPIVRNQNYKAFNGIQKLKAGETVSVYSDTTEYRYTVTGVRLANATEDVIELPATGKFLTLVTCDSFGTKSDRFVVTAELQGSYTI